MAKVLCTGGTGFVGANLVRRLLREGHELHLLVRPTYKTWRIADIAQDVKLYVVDFTDTSALDQIVAGIRPDYIFHLAAYGAYSSQANLHQMIQTNFIGTVNLVQACLKTGFESFINAGSSSEYGLKQHAPTEDEWVDPNSYYAVTKVASTQFCRHTAQSQKAQIITLRLYSVFGPYEEPTRLIPSLIVNGMHGELPLLVNPNIARDFVYSEDVNDAFLLAAKTPSKEFGSVFNVGSGIQTTLKEIVDITRTELNISVEPQWGSMPDREWDTNVWVASNQAIQKALDWQPKHTFVEGFRLTVSWFRDDRDRLQVYHENQDMPT